MDFSLTGKNVLVTGSTKGIGLEIAKKFKREGCNVIINSRNEFELEKEKALNSFADIFPADFSNYEQTKKNIPNLIEKIKHIDVLICNVGNGKSVPPGKENYAEWQRVFSSNFWSTIIAIELLEPYFKNNESSIVCISSICGVETIKGAPLTYSAAKASLNAYVKGISRPFGEKGIRVNAIAPGNILFPGSTWETKLKNDPQKVDNIIMNEVSLKSFGTPDDVANLSLFLASPLSKFVTGSIFTIDGGQIH